MNFHRENNDISYSISGYRGVEEAIQIFLTNLPKIKLAAYQAGSEINHGILQQIKTEVNTQRKND